MVFKMHKLIIIFSMRFLLKLNSLILLMLAGLYVAGCASAVHEPGNRENVKTEPAAMFHDNSSEHNNHAVHEASQHTTDRQFTSRENAVTQSSPSGKYRLSLFCDDPEIPLQKIHSWTLHVEDASGKPADNLKLFVSGGMPMHRHGFPTRPRVSEHLGNGDYRVEGIKFNMAGHWEMRFNINEIDKPLGRDLEQVVFQIHRK